MDEIPSPVSDAAAGKHISYYKQLPSYGRDGGCI